MSTGVVWAVCISEKKGTKKQDVGEALLLEGFGLRGDAHAGFAHRQVSLLSLEDIEEMRDKIPDVGPGAFAENLTVKGFDMGCLSVGDRLAVGEAVLEVTQIGKNCHGECEIYKLAGECIMPKKGTFCSVIKSGAVRRGDPVQRLTDVSM